jgi:hypothetical protein
MALDLLPPASTHRPSFRGAPPISGLPEIGALSAHVGYGRLGWRERGIHKPRLWLWIPGPALTRPPGMTTVECERF